MNSSANLAPSAADISADHRLRQASAPTAPAVTVRVARSFAEIESLRELWSSWPSHRDSNIDLCQQVVWSREEVICPHVIVVYRDGVPVTMLVGWLERTLVAFKIGYLRLPRVRSRALKFSYGGLLGECSAENCDEIVSSIMSSLRDGDADVALLRDPSADSAIYQSAQSVPSIFSRDHLASPAAHHFMILPPTLEQVYLGLSSGHRKHLRSEAKKLQKDFQGGLRITCYFESAELERALKDVEEIARKTYQRELGFGFEGTQQMRDLLEFFAQKGWLRIYILYLGESPAAFSVGSVSDGVYCCDFLGYDPRFGKYSPGTFLLTRMLEDFCDAGVTKVDFGAGGGAYKERFGNLRLMEASVSIFAPTLKGFALNAIRTLTGTVDQLAKKTLEKTDLLPKIKRLWRNRATRHDLPTSS
jgi:CelD/BcsL family acetyltransferase involved in cellulose biosynthesis